MAKLILKTYPEYSKSPPEYLAAIVSVIASYPLETQNRLANLRVGIPAKCKFLPTVADIVQMGDELAKPRFGEVRDYGPRVVDTTPYHPEIVPYISNRETRNPDEYSQFRADDEKTKEGIRRADRMLAYVKTLGHGSALDGWLVAIEQGITEPPADFEADNLTIPDFLRRAKPQQGEAA